MNKFIKVRAFAYDFKYLSNLTFTINVNNITHTQITDDLIYIKMIDDELSFYLESPNSFNADYIYLKHNDFIELVDILTKGNE